MSLSRRDFLKVGGTGAGSLVIGLSLPGCSGRGRKPSEPDAWAANAWLEITPDDRVIFTLDRVEMGQGTYTGITTLVAEELDVHPENIEVVFAPVGSDYANPEYILQLTGGSTSIATSWDRIRKAGAGTRALMVKSAAEVWQVSETGLSTDNGHVISPDGQQRLSYGTLVAVASRQSMPRDIPLKDPADYRYIGKYNKRLDARAKVTGTAEFGIDVERPGLVYAVVTRPPRVGARVSEVDSSAAREQKGFIDVVTIDRGVAVVADTYWHALKAQKALSVTWDDRDALRKTHDSIFAEYRQAADDRRGDTERRDGRADRVIRDASEVFSAEYEAPFLAHATMEPQNCTAEVTENGLEIWAPTQAPDVARIAAARTSGYSPGNITVHTTFLGGGFGRRLTQEYVEEAAAIAVEVERPVKVIWSREEDMRHDMYRPGMLHRFQGTLNGDRIEAWDHQLVGPQILDWYVRNAAAAQYPWAPRFMYNALARIGSMAEGIATPKDFSAIEGAIEYPYEVPNVLVRHTHADAGIPVSYWRAVGHSHNGFAVETFMDELAAKAGIDPIAFRLNHLPEGDRHRRVLETVAEMSDWMGPVPEGRGRGVALHKSFGSYVAQVVEASISNGSVHVHKVFCAVDCGRMINPDIVHMQMESGIIFGLTAALYGKIDWEDGVVVQSNFTDYRLLQQDEVPDMAVEMIQSEADPTGVGEPGLPPVIPALGNALFNLTGKRQRKTPFVADA